MTEVSQDSETLATGKQVITAAAFIHQDFDGITKVFMPKRATTKQTLPDKYELPGGHIDFGENLLYGLQRELRDVLNMTASIGDPFAAFTATDDSKGTHTLEVVYFATFVDDIANVTLNPEDHSRFDWFSKQEVLEHRAEILPGDEHMSRMMYDEGQPDPEYLAILKGFDLLAGANLSKG